MRVDTETLRTHYESLSDDALLELDPAELTESARTVLEEELRRRGLAAVGGSAAEEVAAEAEPPVEGDLEPDTDEAPEWLEDAACACSFAVHPHGAASSDAARARAVLRAAGIPCHIVMTEDSPVPGTPARQYLCVMVPGPLPMHASSILDRDIFNEQYEAEWRTHLGELSGENLRALTPDIFCAGLLDRAERMKRAYNEELSRRRVSPRV